MMNIDPVPRRATATVAMCNFLKKKRHVFILLVRTHLGFALAGEVRPRRGVRC